MVALISISLALSPSPVYTARPRIKGYCMVHYTQRDGQAEVTSKNVLFNKSTADTWHMTYRRLSISWRDSDCRQMLLLLLYWSQCIRNIPTITATAGYWSNLCCRRRNILILETTCSATWLSWRQCTSFSRHWSIWNCHTKQISHVILDQTANLYVVICQHFDNYCCLLQNNFFSPIFA